MSEMNEGQKSTLKIVETIVIGVLLLACVIAGGIIVNNYVAMSQGYELRQTVYTTSAGPQWQKVQ